MLKNAIHSIYDWHPKRHPILAIGAFKFRACISDSGRFVEQEVDGRWVKVADVPSWAGFWQERVLLEATNEDAEVKAYITAARVTRRLQGGKL